MDVIAIIEIDRFNKLCIIFKLLQAFLACNKSNYEKRYNAIRDFNKSLQPYLVHIASKGIVTFDNAARYIKQHATDGE